MQASTRTCGRSAADSMTPECRLKSNQVKSIYFNHPSQDNSTNYNRQGCASYKSTNRSIPSEASEVSTPSSIFIVISSSSTGELFAHNQSEAMFAELGEYSQKMLSEAFGTANIALSQFDEYSQPGWRSKRSLN